MAVNKAGHHRTHQKIQQVAKEQRRQAAKLRQKRVKPLPANALQMRLIIVWLVFFGGIFGLVARIFYLQIVDYSRLGRLAAEQHQVTLRPYVPRRNIVDRNGNTLALDHITYNLYAHPVGFSLPEQLLEQTPEAIAKDKHRAIAYYVAPILGEVSEQELAARFRQNEQTKTSIILSENIDSTQAAEIRRLRIDGLELVERFGRFYPQKDAVTEIIGYVQKDNHVGKAGLEYSQEGLIQREPLSLQLKRSGNGSLFPANLRIDAMKYDDWDLRLTIDLPLQRAAREAMKKQMAAFNAERGAVIVMDVKSGELLTLATEPTYDPANYYKLKKEEHRLFQNWAVADLYEPGSTFKPINVALALDAGVITPNTTIYDSGSIRVGIHSIKNFDGGGNGSIDVAGILRVSSNVGMILLMQNLKVGDYYDRLLKLQLNQPTGVDLPGETAGTIKDRETFTAGKIEAAVTAFGQGFTLTPLKLAQLHAAIANGGTLVRPHVVQGLFDSKGEPQTVTPKFEVPRSPEELKALEEAAAKAANPRIFSPEAAKKVLEMMETVVEDGSGTAAKIDGYRIAGKTGTAQKAMNGIYIPGAYITSFVSMFPVENPRYVVMAVVDEPKAPNSFGGTVAAPIVHDVLAALIAREKIAPYKVPAPTATPTPAETPRN